MFVSRVTISFISSMKPTPPPNNSTCQQNWSDADQKTRSQLYRRAVHSHAVRSLFLHTVLL